LRDDVGVPLRNLFAGRDYQQNLFLVNSQERDFKALALKLTLVGLDDSKQEIASFSLPGIKAWEKQEQTITIPIPANAKPGIYQLRVVVLEDGTEVSRNFYDLFIQSQDVVTEKLPPTDKRIAVIGPNSADGNKLLQVFADLGIAFTEIASLDNLTNYDLVVIPPTDRPYTLFENHDNAVKLMSWVGTGGTLIQLEQNYFGQAPTGQSLVLAENTFVDVAIPAHPAFSGLHQSNFDTWNNPNFGYSIYYGLAPFTTNALAVRGPFLGRTDISNAVSEGTYGNGRIFTSQLTATSLWDQDSAATTYLKNVFKYMLVANQPYRDVREWVTDSTGYVVAKERVEKIDLKPYANRSFTDDVEGDKKGGWDDQGINDFRTMPLGTQTLLGIPFEIIDPKTNNDKSCIVLGGADRQYFPQSVEGIAVDQHFSRLFFLHTSAWTKNEAMGEYRVRYEDGSVEKIVLAGGVNIGDWWFPNDWPGAKVALTKQNPLNQLVALWALVWDNPNPDKKITAIDFVSYGNAVPILVAISGEKATLDPLIIDDFETEKEWVAMATGEHPEPTVERINKESEPENIQAGNWALKIKMPAKQESGVPVVFTRFPLDKLKEGNSYSYLTFWIKASNFGKLSIGLPKDDWSQGLWYDLTFKPGEWQKVRLHLGEDMGLENMDWTLEQLRGELFFYGMRDEAIIYLDGIVLE
jgi:beta-galactosidase